MARAAAMAAASSVQRVVKSTLSREVLDDIYELSLKPQTGVSLKYMMDFGANPTPRNLLLSAQFLHNELPVRLAHRVRELETLPYGLSAKPPILKVRDWYVESFRELRDFGSLRSADDEIEFTKLLGHIKERHNNVVPVVALGVHMLKRDLQAKHLHHLPEIHEFLDAFYMSRIGIRMLIGQHLALHAPPQPGMIGQIGINTSPVAIAEEAIEEARHICMWQYGDAPDVQIYGDRTFTFPYVPSHMHHILFELVKNSLRAVLERYQDGDGSAPPIRVIVADGSEDVTIKVSDEGGGIPRSGMPQIFTYMYSTARTSQITEDMDLDNLPAVLAGYGYGLPLSRLYARYFGGDLQIMSMEGYGTDAYVHCHRLADAQEPLP